MAEGSLSQDEIDALLKSIGAEAPAPAAPAPAGGAVPGLEDRIGRAAARASSVLSTLLSRKIDVVTAGPARLGAADIWKGSPGGAVVVFEAQLAGAATGAVAWAVAKPAAAALADLMMGGDASNPPADLDEVYASALREAAGQALTAMMNALSEEVGGAVTPTPAEMRVVDLGAEPNLPLAGGEVAVVPLRFSIEGVAEGDAAIGFPAATARALAGAAAAAPAPAAQPMVRPAPAAPVTYQPVQFPTLTPGPAAAMPKNIDLLLDVPMQLTVELGRTQRFIKDILDLSTGSIIELDKLAGEPVDILVNGKLVARGEVVVIDENFGVRVIDIISPMERMKTLQ